MIELDELDGGGGGATGPRVPGRLGNAVKLNGVADYVSLPPGIVSGLSDFTISVWVNPAAISTWSRVFDFGSGTAVNMFLTVNAGAGPRFAITTSGGGAEQRLSRSGQLPLNAWTHLAVSLSGTIGTLYVNGVPAATNSSMTLRPSDLGATTNNWIGRSQYSDPFLNATVDDFQIYDRALDVTAIQHLAAGELGAGTVASYRFDEDGGADALDSSGNGRTATIISPPVNVVTPQGLTGYWEAPYLFKRSDVYYLAYARGTPGPVGTRPPSITRPPPSRWVRGRIAAAFSTPSTTRRPTTPRSSSSRTSGTSSTTTACCPAAASFVDRCASTVSTSTTTAPSSP